MTNYQITKLTQKYTQREITTAVKVLVDILDMQKQENSKFLDPKTEFTPAQIKRLQKQLTEHAKKKSEALTFNEVKNAVGV